MVCKTLGEKVLNTSDIKKVCDLNSSKYINKKNETCGTQWLATKICQFSRLDPPPKDTWILCCADRQGSARGHFAIQYAVSWRLLGKGPLCIRITDFAHSDLCELMRLFETSNQTFSDANRQSVATCKLLR